MIGRRSIKNLRYAHDTTLMAESKDELKSLLMKVKEKSERANLEMNIKKKKKTKLRSWHWPNNKFMSNSLRPHGLQYTRLPSPSPSPGACSISCPLSWWYHPTILHSIIPFSSWLQSFPASGSFPMSQLFQSGGQSNEASASASVLSMNNHGWFPLGLTGFISLKYRELSGVLQCHSSKALILWHSAFFVVQLSHPYMTEEKTITLTIWILVGKVISLLFNTLSLS